MLSINVVLGCLMTLVIVIGLFWAFANYRQYKKNSRVSEDLDIILQTALNQVKQVREAAKKQENRSLSDARGSFETGLAPNLTSPEVLSTIVTVLVRKYGDARLSMKDFAIPDDEYVSVYVDVNTKELILSLNNNLAPDDPYSMMNFADPDDNTFH